MLTKPALINHLSERLQQVHGLRGVSKLAIGIVLDELAATAGETVRTEGKFTVPGIVMLERVERAARTGRNPATGEPLSIPAKVGVKARPCKALRAAAV